MPTSSEAARPTHSSSTMLHTPASAMLPSVFTPTTARASVVPASRPRAAASLFGTSSSQRTSHSSGADDACEDSQEPEKFLPLSQDEIDNRYAISLDPFSAFVVLFLRYPSL